MGLAYELTRVLSTCRALADAYYCRSGIQHAIAFYSRRMTILLRHNGRIYENDDFVDPHMLYCD